MVSNNGQVLGNCLYSALGLAVVWTNDTPTVLPTLGGVSSSGTAINNNGQIVANATDTANGQTHALLLNPS